MHFLGASGYLAVEDVVLLVHDLLGELWTYPVIFDDVFYLLHVLHCLTAVVEVLAHTAHPALVLQGTSVIAKSDGAVQR